MKKKTVTMADVSKLANVSQSTVSLILGKKRDLSSFPKETVERVTKAAQQLNYRIKTSIYKGHIDSKSTSKTIMVLAVKMTRQDYAGMLQAIEKEAFVNGYTVFTCNTYHNPLIEEKYLNIALEENVGGIIYIYPPDNISVFNEVSKLIPIIAICDAGTNLNTDIVEINSYKVGVLSARHLIELGHKKIAFLTYPIDETVSRVARFAGIKDELTKNGLFDDLTICVKNTPSNEILGDNNYEYQIGIELAQDKRLYENNITGILCVNDMLALGVIESILKGGYKIPKDFSVVGFGNMFFSKFLGIPLTTVDPYATMAAKSAIEILFHKIKVKETEKFLSNMPVKFKMECNPELIVRKSTGVAKKSTKS